VSNQAHDGNTLAKPRAHPLADKTAAPPHTTEETVNFKTCITWIAAGLTAALLTACGGNSDSSDTGSVRLVNATQDFAALDLYTSDTQQLSAVAESTASSYVTLGASSYTFNVKLAGSSTTALSESLTIAKDTAYTLVAYNNGSKLAAAYFTDNQSAPTSGTAALRVFNGAAPAGSVDVYVIALDADLADAAAMASSVSAAGVSSYVEITKGTYRVVVTGAGDKTDVRLDIPSVTLADQQVATMMLTGTSGGVLVNGLLLNQEGTLAAYPNTNARVRIVAAVDSNGTVSATTDAGTLVSGLQAPSVGSYVTTPATLAGLSLKVNGVAMDTSAVSASAGADLTFFVYGAAAAPQLAVLVDDNKPATTTANTKLRLVHGLSGLGSTVTLNADYVTVADNVAYGSASTAASIAASTTMRLEATSPLKSTPLYLATDVTLVAQKVYTLFLLGDASAPVAVLKRDR
jgi:hypothetical protein